MCGIFGVTEITDITECIIPFLAYEMEDRGKDSWGITDGKHVYKKMGYITDSFMVPDWNQLIGHCRAASVGQVKLPNQHPFYFKKKNGGYILGIHNGTLSNHSELNDKYDRKFSCDTMHIFANLAEEKGLEDIRGSAVIAYYDENKDLHLGRFNSSNLEVCRLTSGEWVFASSMAIRKAIRAGGGEIDSWAKLDSNKIYRYNKESDSFECVLETKFGEYQYTSHISHHKGPWRNAHHSEYIYTGGSFTSSDDDKKEDKKEEKVSNLPVLIRTALRAQAEDDEDHFDYKQCEICECWAKAEEWPVCQECLASFNAKIIMDTDNDRGVNTVNDWIDNYVLKAITAS